MLSLAVDPDCISRILRKTPDQTSRSAVPAQRRALIGCGLQFAFALGGERSLWPREIIEPLIIQRLLTMHRSRYVRRLGRTQYNPRRDPLQLAGGLKKRRGDKTTATTTTTTTTASTMQDAGSPCGRGKAKVTAALLVLLL
ncbi:uncharacterized protein [Polyergus mexicanus]|uniref:uncharacterized protein n=1 Tax=Polyergus mexicanus TaxID=615972 RepID=UPI0038B438C9